MTHLELMEENRQLRQERDELRRQVIAGVYDAATVGMTMIDTKKLEGEREEVTLLRALIQEKEPDAACYCSDWMVVGDQKKCWNCRAATLLRGGRQE